MAGKLTLIKSSNSFPLIKTNVESIRYILSKAYSALFRTAAESAAGIVRINAATLTS